MDTLRCLVLLPTEPSYTQRSYNAMMDMLSSAVSRSGIKPLRLESAIPYGAPITHLADTVRLAIESADMLIADLTGTSPNIMYEVGYAHALRKPVLPIMESGDQQIPSDLSGYLYYVYKSGRLDELEKVVINWAHRTATQSTKR